MKAISVLPDGYREYDSIDLQKNKRLAFGVNAAALVIALLMAVPAAFLVPISALFDMEKGLGAYALRFGCLLGSIVLYMILHELVHGIAMKLCGTKKVKYGFTGLYAFAGSNDYYGKRAYLFIALAPVVLWGIVLGVINFFVSVEWFWVVYLIQMCNISGAAGDFYVTLRFLRYPKDILIRDRGVGMTVYTKWEN